MGAPAPFQLHVTCENLTRADIFHRQRLTEQQVVNTASSLAQVVNILDFLEQLRVSDHAPAPHQLTGHDRAGEIHVLGRTHIAGDNLSHAHFIRQLEEMADIVNATFIYELFGC